MVNIHWSNDLIVDMHSIDYIPTKCVIGLDRDGVINENRSDYVKHPSEFVPVDRSIEAIAGLRKAGFGIVIITNQAGIFKKMCTEEDVNKVHLHMLKLLGAAGCPSIDGIYFSITNQKDDYYAKPNLGMFKKAEDEQKHKNIKFSSGYYVGDKLTDLKAASKIKATPVLVRTGHGADTEKELKKFTYRELNKKTIIFDDLFSFYEYVTSKSS